MTRPALTLVLPETPSLALVETKRLAAMAGPRRDVMEYPGGHKWERREHAAAVLRARSAINYGEEITI